MTGPDGSVIRHVELADTDQQGPQLICELFSCGGGGGGGYSGTYLNRINNFSVCDNICIAEGVEFKFNSIAQFGGAQVQVSSTLSGVPTCGWPFNFQVSPCLSAQWSGLHLASVYRVPTNGWVELRVLEDDGFLNQDDPFFCAYAANQLPRPECSPFLQQTFSPRMGYGATEFPLCENLPWTCKYTTTEDVRMRFETR